MDLSNVYGFNVIVIGLNTIIAMIIALAAGKAHEVIHAMRAKQLGYKVNKITLWKQQNDVAVFLVAHPKKLQKIQNGERAGLYEIPTMYDIAGSSNFYNKADMGISIYRNFKDGMTYFYMQKVKYRNLGEVGMCTFKYNMLNNRFEPAELDPSGQVDTRGNRTVNSLKIRNDNLLVEDIEQVEMPMSSGITPNTEFDDDLPF